MLPSRESVGGGRASIVLPTGSFHQGFDEAAARPAVASSPARALDLVHRPGSRRDGELDGVVGYAEAEAEDHRRALPRNVGIVIRVTFRSFLGPQYRVN